MNKQTEHHSSPYLNGRREWNERYGSYISSMKMWRWVALLSLVVAAIAVAGTVHLASQNKLIPYVVEIDKEGNILKVSEISIATDVDKRITQSEIGQLIKDMFGVSSDFAVQEEAISRLYAHLSADLPGEKQVSAWMRLNNPYERAETETVSIDIHQVLPVTDQTWRVEWSEKTISSTGEALPVLKMTGTVAIVIGAVRENKMMLNPVGIYVRNIAWSQDLTGGRQ
jgi:type IV secretory pathway TrbF-like protein